MSILDKYGDKKFWSDLRQRVKNFERRAPKWLLEDKITNIEEDLMTFALEGKELERARKWLDEKRVEILEKQRKVCKDCAPDAFCIKHCGKYPYFGAIGGGITYSFTPTGLGMCIEVEYGGEKLNVTSFEDW